MKGIPLSRESYVRHLPFSAVMRLSMELDVDQFFEKMIANIPKNLDPHVPFLPRYTALHVSLFSREKSPTRAILQDWGTQNCTLNHLITVLEETRLLEAAKFIKTEILHEEEEEEETEEYQLPIPEPLLPPLAINAVPGNHPDRLEAADPGYLGSLDLTKLVEDTTTTTSTRQPVQQNDLSVTPPSSMGSLGTLNYQNKFASMGGREALPQCAPNMNTYVSEEKLQGNVAVKKVGPELLKTVHASPRQHLSDSDGTYLTPTLPDGDGTYLTPTLPEYGTPLPPPAKIEPLIQSKGGLQHISYSDLARITDDFNDSQYSHGGRLIGKGGFGMVHLGLDHDGRKVAVKVLKQNTESEKKQFQVEVKTLVEHQHTNLVCLLGYSLDGPRPCIVFEYLPNGSLEDRLSRLNGSPPLPASTRHSINRGSARAIAYLNNSGFIHRDVKSANILLDQDFVPKLGDFATARVGPTGSGQTMAETSVVIGTSAYLAPEAHLFQVSAKLDSYSFGVVLLEMLTGLPAYDASREDRALWSHMTENCVDIMKMVDPLAGDWLESDAKQLYEIALKCLEHSWKKRVLVSDVLPQLECL